MGVLRRTGNCMGTLVFLGRCSYSQMGGRGGEERGGRSGEMEEQVHRRKGADAAVEFLKLV